ncbi:hypothetical protein PTSG_06306 [Salpingoeca rosetta]|uniref:Probable methyltransferase BMT2 homolog n=1 Tax=Salpingoeca rosetta (strain ATCC 50818 / BSB-021) TaxID=946362 RepID=F2UCJ0_SALR5|nr:uncharacterized protein PTSG_06306 [Salpingoeca rosetta]EGD74297.1 hypothetical protein PTSG_06306 [Salpingoeca rosetta]|eukprot:XP_004993197.1 hypothetical protein PTSG_06306 [Salpingoeca rosetta]
MGGVFSAIGAAGNKAEEAEVGGEDASAQTPVKEQEGAAQREAEAVKQQDLSTWIKGHHRRLRKRVQNPSPETLKKAERTAKQLGVSLEQALAEHIWKDHLSDATALETYAQAMRTLATSFWKRDDAADSRINWCLKMMRNYFEGGGRSAAVAKDARRRTHKQAATPATPATAEAGETAKRRRGHNAHGSGDVYSGNGELAFKRARRAAGQSEDDAPTATAPHSATSSPTASQASSTRDDDRGVPTTLTDVHLLDVGSSFNAFRRHNLHVDAIDIAPAADGVIRCDFLNAPIVSITEHTASSPSSSSSFQLVEGSYDVVVFNFLLSYIPTPALRYRCCERARRCLKRNGLLLITTPDSNHVAKGSKWMREWRTSVESIGFRRWRYEKLKFFHGIAFRAVADEDAVEPTSLSRNELMALMARPSDPIFEDK